MSWSQLPTIKEQEPELLLLPEFLEHPGHFLDVGANNGVYLYAALSKKDPSELVAIEPIPRLFRLLKRAFPKVSSHMLALTDSEGPKLLKIPDFGGRTYPTRASLNINHQEPGETGQKLIQVSTMTLDAFWKSIGDPPLCCIKIDTEGHEGTVLEGAKETLQRHRPILLVEIEQRHHQGDIAGIFDMLAGLGYSSYYFDPATPAILPIVGSNEAVKKAQGADVRYLNNFFFLPTESKAFMDILNRINQRMPAPASMSIN